jgi:hypothetical protein
MPTRRPWLVLSAALLIVAACSSQPSPTPTPSPSPAPTQTAPATPSPPPTPAVAGSLGEALSLVGPIPRTIWFMDWAALRSSVGAEDLTGASAFEDKFRAIRNDSTLGGFGLTDLATHAADWGFDVFDLDWEAAVQAGGPIVWTLRLRDGFDPAVLVAKLDAYGFAAEQLPRGILRTGTMANLRQGTRLLGNPTFLNTGLLDDGRTLVLSFGGADEVRSVLTEGPQAVADLSVLSVAGLLGAPIMAAILVGDTCHDVAGTLAQVPADVRVVIDAQLAGAGPLAAYNVLAVSYARAAGVTAGRIVMGYPEEGQAEADLEGRRTLAANGISLLSRDASALLHYADRSFVLVNARTAERSIVLEVGAPTFATPTPNAGTIILVTDFLPRGLVALVARHDLLFAAC